MKFQYTIEQLERSKKNLEEDIQWYKRKNKPGVNLSAKYRKEMIAEHTAQLTEIIHAIKLLSDDRFNAIEANLIQFNMIEANLILLGSMIRKINPKCLGMKQECIDLIQEILHRYFQTDR